MTTARFHWALIICGALLSWGALDGPFIFDDINAIVGNESIRQLWPPDWLPATEEGSPPVRSRPVTNLSLALNYAVGGLHPGGYRIFNTLIHVGCGLLLFGLLRRRLGGDEPAFWWALLWLTHPLQTQCLHYITQRSESLATFFYLAVLACLTRSLASGRPRAWLALGTAMCFLGMAAKEMMVTAPVVVLLYDAVFLAGSVSAAWKARRTFYLMLPSSWSLVLLLLWNAPHTDSIGFAGDVSALQYATNQCVAVVQYVRLVLFPHPLVLDYGFSRRLLVAQWLPSALLLLSLAGVAIALVRRHPPLVFLALAVVLVLSPTTSFIPLLNEFAAERRLYLPLAGMVGLVPLSLLLTQRHRWGRPILAALAAVFFLTSITRSDDYRSREVIWRSSLAAWPANPRNYANLGAVLGSSDQDSTAISLIRQAIIMRPDFGEAHLNLGTLFKSAGQQDSAIVHLRAALPDLKNDTQRFLAHHRLGIVLRTQGYAQQALEQQRAALQLSPTSVVAHYELAFGLHEQGDLKAAVASYRAALALSPKYRPAHYNLGVALEKLGQTDAAQYHLRMAEELAREN